ncbi:hypothetical protein ACFWPK_28255 [Nocardia sp. NPDC058519]|uniref:hypothetical protein n=1 Tax=Nocardia sp. NPDC058519 TaxID=3346535 RepID=UPI00365E0812
MSKPSAREFIAQTIKDHADANGEVPAKLILKLATAAGYKIGTINVARSNGGFRTRKVGQSNVWSMPVDDAEEQTNSSPSLFDELDQLPAPVTQLDIDRLHDRVARVENAMSMFRLAIAQSIAHPQIMTIFGEMEGKHVDDAQDEVRK